MNIFWDIFFPISEEKKLAPKDEREAGDEKIEEQLEERNR